jgi:hypothetical protein
MVGLDLKRGPGVNSTFSAGLFCTLSSKASKQAITIDLGQPEGLSLRWLHRLFRPTRPTTAAAVYCFFLEKKNSRGRGFARFANERLHRPRLELPAAKASLSQPQPLNKLAGEGQDEPAAPAPRTDTSSKSNQGEPWTAPI